MCGLANETRNLYDPLSPLRRPRMKSLLHRAWARARKPRALDGLRFDRPLLLFQSDDWGRVGVRDHEGCDALRAAGVPLGESPYDFYSFETADDLTALREVLKGHNDSAGRHPAIVMNFVTANVDFARCLASGGHEISLLPLSEGLPDPWTRPRLFEEYRRGIAEGMFFPALHGLTHFCAKAVARELKTDGERGRLVRKLWSAGTPYIHWRMPWIGYEYWDIEAKSDQYLAVEDQQLAIQQAVGLYQKLFNSTPVSACAPGYRSNANTHKAWFDNGIRVAQNGPGGRQAPFLDRRGMLHTFRTVEMEPAVTPCSLESLIGDAEKCFRSGLPAIVSIHSINFHSTIRDFRTLTLALLDQFLSALEMKWPKMLYVHDADLLCIATEGAYLANGRSISVNEINVSAER